MLPKTIMFYDFLKNIEISESVCETVCANCVLGIERTLDCHVFNNMAAMIPAFHCDYDSWLIVIMIHG
jgi:hypothetical protein